MVLAMAVSTAAGQYKLPPKAVVEILDAAPTPMVAMSPDRSWMLLMDYEAYPPISMLARPYERLGGVRIDPGFVARQRGTQARSIRVKSLRDLAAVERKIELPEGIRFSGATFNYDGSRFAFVEDTEGGLTVWVVDTKTGVPTRVEGVRVTDVLGGAMAWLDNDRIALRTIPASRGAAPSRPRVPAGPVVSETAGKQSKMATFQDLLSDSFDEALFAHYGTSQWVVLDVKSGGLTTVGKPDLYTGVSPSPDGKWWLVSRLKQPFSYRVPFGFFARTTEVWDATTGQVVATIADLPVSDEIPQQGVPVGPRGVDWQELRPATLLWAEALDGGDPLKKVPHRDRMLKLEAPFTSAPSEFHRVTHRYGGLDFLASPDKVVVTESDRDRRWRTSYFLDLAATDAPRRNLFDLSVNDAYSNPGNLVYETKPDGTQVVLERDGKVYLSGRGASPKGDRPFLDEMVLTTGEKKRLWQSDEGKLEVFSAFVETPTEKSPARLIITSQSKTSPVNYLVVQGSEATALTEFKDPHPQLTGITKELIKYKRADGVPLSGTLYLPPGYDKARDGKLPVLLWAYPEEFSDASTAGQVRGSDKNFTRLGGTSPLFFLTQGYAVLMDATMPVVGTPETMNDTFVEQIVGAAKAAIDELDRLGVGDPRRVVVSGHSYGAFMTANLLAHSGDLFACGIARSGAYNRTLTPFGFQSERRDFWSAKDVYMQLSPFTYANQIKQPLLLIHGQADNNPGTYTVQSERMYDALKATGGTARLVLLPHESHGYRARESVLHTLAEMFEWADLYAKNRK